jgi:hypothetical protein
MLSHNYRIRLENICERIASQKEVTFEEMMWAQKLAKNNRHADKILRQARRTSQTPDMQEGDMDDFLNQLDLGNPDPTTHLTGESSINDIVDFFKRDDDDNTWLRRD